MGRSRLKFAKFTAIAVLAGLAWVGLAAAQDVPPQPGAAVSSSRRRQVVVSLPDRKLAVLEEGKVIRIFAVAVGADVSPSPGGEFQIAHRLQNPTYYHPGVVIPPGKDNPLGPRWVGLNQKGFGIHGTNQPWSIGKPASHGCIRMLNRDVVQFFEMVRVGDTVEISGERTAEIAQIFGVKEDVKTVAAAQRQPTVSGVGGGQ